MASPGHKNLVENGGLDEELSADQHRRGDAHSGCGFGKVEPGLRYGIGMLKRQPHNHCERTERLRKNDRGWTENILIYTWREKSVKPLMFEQFLSIR